MPLFEVEGWGLENKEIKLGGVAESNRSKKNKKKQAKIYAAKQLAHENGEYNDQEEEEEGGDQDETSEEAKKSKTKKDEKLVKNEKSKTKENKKRKAVEVEQLKQQQHPTIDTIKKQRQEMSSPAVPTKLTPLQQKMLTKLSGSRFRFINEKLYTITSKEALDLIKEQPQLFDVYHEGFKSQVTSWPQNPVDVFVDIIKQRSAKQMNAPGGLPGLKKSRQIVIADMGCGEAQLSSDVSKFVSQMPKKHKKDIVVHSFDLKKANNRITVADIKNVPLPDESCSVVIFCLALMGTNFLDFIKEAHRLLIPRGELWISEIKSRFADKQGDEFVKTLKLLGFFHKTTDDSNKMFTRFEFFKPAQDILDEKVNKLQRHSRLAELENEQLEEFNSKRKDKNESQWLLKPCIYKRR